MSLGEDSTLQLNNPLYRSDASSSGSGYDFQARGLSFGPAAGQSGAGAQSPPWQQQQQPSGVQHGGNSSSLPREFPLSPPRAQQQQQQQQAWTMKDQSQHSKYSTQQATPQQIALHRQGQDSFQQRFNDAQQHVQQHPQHHVLPEQSVGPVKQFALPQQQVVDQPAQ